MMSRCWFPHLAWLAFLGVLALAIGAGAAYAKNDIAPDLIRRVELQWEKQENAQTYELELGLDPEFGSTLYTEKVKNDHFNVDLLPGAYYYRVRSIDLQGRPGRWSAVQELKINARPPVLLWPPHTYKFVGNLLDTGIKLDWRTSGPGIRYLIEIKGMNDKGEFTETLVRQEVNDTVFPFFPVNPGRFQWSVHTIGAGGDEPGAPWEFEVEGVFPRKVKLPPGAVPKRIVRYVPPWWRGHWTLFARYGQASLDYAIKDQDFRASGSFAGFTGYVGLTLNWEWHDPLPRVRGIPWGEIEWENGRQTVLGESLVLPRGMIRGGLWYDEIVDPFRFSPVIEYGFREIAFYQPLSETRAVRSDSTRRILAFGGSAEWQPRSYLTFSTTAKILLERGGKSGIYPRGGIYALENRAGDLKDSTGFEIHGSGTLSLGPYVRLQGRLRYETMSESWVGHFFSADPTGDTDTRVSIRNIGFDLSFGVKF